MYLLIAVLRNINNNNIFVRILNDLSIMQLIVGKNCLLRI